jgi:hypothetical protein
VKAHLFRTIEELHSVPEDKVDHMLEDLKIWLQMVRECKHPTLQRDIFGWIDDGKHEPSLLLAQSGTFEHLKELEAEEL